MTVLKDIKEKLARRTVTFPDSIVPGTDGCYTVREEEGKIEIRLAVAAEHKTEEHTVAAAQDLLNALDFLQENDFVKLVHGYGHFEDREFYVLLDLEGYDPGVKIILQEPVGMKPKFIL